MVQLVLSASVLTVRIHIGCKLISVFGCVWAYYNETVCVLDSYSGLGLHPTLPQFPCSQ